MNYRSFYSNFNNRSSLFYVENIQAMNLYFCHEHKSSHFNSQDLTHIKIKPMRYRKVDFIFVKKENKKWEKSWPWRLWSSHFDCLVLIWLAHHHEYALLAALCNIFPPSSSFLPSLFVPDIIKILFWYRA